MAKLTFAFVFFLAATSRCFAVDFGAVAVANWSDDAGQNHSAIGIASRENAPLAAAAAIDACQKEGGIGCGVKATFGKEPGPLALSPVGDCGYATTGIYAGGSRWAVDVTPQEAARRCINANGDAGGSGRNAVCNRPIGICVGPLSPSGAINCEGFAIFAQTMVETRNRGVAKWQQEALIDKQQTWSVSEKQHLGASLELAYAMQTSPAQMYARTVATCEKEGWAPEDRTYTSGTHAPESTDPDNGFIFPDSDQRLLTVADLQGLSSDQLRIARNEIYARKGRFFKDQSLTAHFSQFSWYQPNGWDVTLNDVEQANVRLIQCPSSDNLRQMAG
jgi:hypothetical protein